MHFAALHRFFAALLVLAYLLVGSGLAHAVVWCIDESGHSHVEFNPAGDCKVSCESSEKQQTGPALPGLTSNTPEKDCQDIGLLTSQARDSRLVQLIPPSTSLVLPQPSLRILAAPLTFTANPRHDLLLPPPISLTSLRTVVLLT